MTNAELDADPAAVTARLLEDFGINVPVLEEDKTVAETKEARVDVSRDPTRFIHNRSRPFYIGGTEITVIVPFPRAQAILTPSRASSRFGLAVNGHPVPVIHRLSGLDQNSQPHRPIILRVVADSHGTRRYECVVRIRWMVLSRVIAWA